MIFEDSQQHRGIIVVLDGSFVYIDLDAAMKPATSVTDRKRWEQQYHQRLSDDVVLDIMQGQPQSYKNTRSAATI